MQPTHFLACILVLAVAGRSVNAFLSPLTHSVQCMHKTRRISAPCGARTGGLHLSPRMQRDPQAMNFVPKSQGKLVKFKAADMEIVRPLGEMGFATVTDVSLFSFRLSLWDCDLAISRTHDDPNIKASTVLILRVGVRIQYTYQ
jgi:hypothetical protein